MRKPMKMNCGGHQEFPDMYFVYLPTMLAVKEIFGIVGLAVQEH
jgi:hypothetical protein